MAKFIVTGGEKLQGNFKPTGNKNESLPAIAASLLTAEPVLLENVPLIQDFLIMKQIVEGIGGKVSFKEKKSLLVDSSDIHDVKLNEELCSQIRGSFLFAAPCLHRFQQAVIPSPGGDSIGRRRLDTHLLALNAMGADIQYKNGKYILKAKKLKGAKILLDEASVMATETALMAAVLAEGETTIYNAACEPHVQGLCNMLNKMGAEIEGIGSNLLKIIGIKTLKGCTHRISADHTEIGSIIGLAAVTNSEIQIEDCKDLDLGLIPLFFQKLGVYFENKEGVIHIPKNQKMEIIHDQDSFLPKIDDGPWPSFPADLTSLMTIVATQCKGSVLIFEKMFESRLFWIDKLISMGASIVLCDPHRAVVNGPTPLRGTKLASPDIRAGMALLLAAMCAEGESHISNIYQIDRGYEKIDVRLNALGAKIQRV